MTYKAATNIAYENFATTTLYKDATCSTPKTESSPADGQAYYDGNGIYCVILPQQTNPATGDRLKIINTTAEKLECTGSMKAVKGMTYFDKYTKNNGVYYTKVIKVQD
jgi:hypothetical protein